MDQEYESYSQMTWNRFARRKLGMLGLFVLLGFSLVGIYAPFLASSKPLVVMYHEEWFFPLFRYLFYQGFYTKKLDIFFNIFILTVPLGGVLFFLSRRFFSLTLALLAICQLAVFIFLLYFPLKDPASDPSLNYLRQEALKTRPLPSWSFDLKYMTPYGKLNLVLRYQQQKNQHRRLSQALHEEIENQTLTLSTLWQMNKNQVENKVAALARVLQEKELRGENGESVQAELNYIQDRQEWLERESKNLKYEVMPLIRPFHWEDDAGGDKKNNRYLPLFELTRINRKDFIAGLIFGVRISLVVGILAVSLGLAIGVPIGALAGFYGGKIDIVVSRLLEIWESMPIFFMLLMVIAIMQTKSIFLIIAVIGLFGWTTFSRYIRAEFFKQRNLPYVEACRALGFNHGRIIFSHILPNAIPPVLTLLPFAIMAAMTSEAGLSFLGLGEEGSCSWGVLMDEGRSAFPAESYLLWPPAILLTWLLISIALIGDSLRDAIDPKMH